MSRAITFAVALFVVAFAATTLLALGGADAGDPAKPKPKEKTAKELAQMGEKLFKDKSLGKSGLTCSSCHPKLKDLTGVYKDYPKKDENGKVTKTLEDQINFMIKTNLKGKELAADSEKVNALVAYLKVFKKESDKDKGKE